MTTSPFTCPSCSGRFFGTANPTAPPEQYVIECHDEHRRGCRWRGTWADVGSDAAARALGLAAGGDDAKGANHV